MTQACPGGHGTQSSSLVIDRLSNVIVPFWWRPDGHGSGADDPSSQYEPATHSKHAVSPSPPWYLPASHLVHEGCLGAGCTVPGEHGVWLSEPVEHAEPAGHSEHWALLPRPRLLLKLPAAHGSGALEPWMQ